MGTFHSFLGWFWQLESLRFEWYIVRGMGCYVSIVMRAYVHYCISLLFVYYFQLIYVYRYTYGTGKLYFRKCCQLGTSLSIYTPVVVPRWTRANTTCVNISLLHSTVSFLWDLNIFRRLWDFHLERTYSVVHARLLIVQYIKLHTTQLARCAILPIHARISDVSKVFHTCSCTSNFDSRWKSRVVCCAGALK